MTVVALAVVALVTVVAFAGVTVAAFVAIAVATASSSIDPSGIIDVLSLDFVRCYFFVAGDPTVSADSDQGPPRGLRDSRRRLQLPPRLRAEDLEGHPGLQGAEIPT